MPLPYGGKVKQVMVDLDLAKLYAKGLSPADVSNALDAQNLILPAGTEKIGDREYNVRLNSSPLVADELNNMPIREVNGAMIYIRDVGQAHDGFAVQQNIVSQNGVRSSLMVVQKSASASTLDIVNRVKAELVKIQAGLPPALTLTQLFDQSIFVRAAINGVLREGVIAACLTALMILLFLGQLAQHGGGGDLDPALDPLLDHHHGRAWADAQYHDPGRPGARGRHPGR